MKKFITLIALSILIINSYGQDSAMEDSIIITIDWENEINKKHKYKDIFSQKDEDYVKWIYKTSKNVTSYVADQNNNYKYYHDGRGNNPIAFTVKENDSFRTEVYKNAILPSKKKKSIFSIGIPNYSIPKIEGRLQKGVTTYFSDSSKGIEIGIKIDKPQRNVRIEILGLDKNLIHIIEDRTLDTGWSHYKWDTTNTEGGQYILKYTVDEKVMTQVIEFEKNKGSLLSRFFNWIF